MYEEYWQLDSKPFEPAADERFLVACESHQAAMHKLRYALESRRSAALLVGPSGVGKTLLTHRLRSQLGNALGDTLQPFVDVVFPLMSSRDFLAYLAESLEAPPADPPQRTIEESLRRIESTLAANHRQGRHAVLVIDEAHLLEDSGLLETIRLLLNLQEAGSPTFTLLLVGQSTLLATLERSASLDERLDIKIVLKAFSVDETASYIQHRLRAAGATRDLFSADALEVVHQLSGGTARRINRICDLALLVGYASGQATIDAGQVQAVSDELVTVRAAA